MTFPSDWWTANLDDEPCDGCGIKPSKHAGHGSYTCETCYAAWWCPKCHYDQRRQPHVCPTPEEQAEYEKQVHEFFAEIGLDWENEV